MTEYHLGLEVLKLSRARALWTDMHEKKYSLYGNLDVSGGWGRPQGVEGQVAGRKRAGKETRVAKRQTHKGAAEVG